MIHSDFALAAVLQPNLAWAPVALMVVIGILFVAGTLIASKLVGPGRQGRIKQTTYESGVTPVMDTRRQFHARFYIVAMIFVVFDVEVVFFYPWATLFPTMAEPSLKGLMLLEMLVFVAILLVAYLYALGKGVFKWD
jgi:NADH-quinone oxidoreductase subunit A